MLIRPPSTIDPKSYQLLQNPGHSFTLYVKFENYGHFDGNC